MISFPSVFDTVYDCGGLSVYITIYPLTTCIKVRESAVGRDAGPDGDAALEPVCVSDLVGTARLPGDAMMRCVFDTTIKGLDSVLNSR